MSDLTTPADFLNALRGLRSLLDNYSIPGQACADAVVQVAALVAAFPAVLDAARRDERVTAAAIAQSHAACSRSDVGRHIARVLKQRADELPPPTRTPERCFVDGCTNPPDPRWFVHDATGKAHPACDGHGCASDYRCAACKRLAPPPTRTPEPAERWNCRCGWSGPRSSLVSKPDRRTLVCPSCEMTSGLISIGVEGPPMNDLTREPEPDEDADPLLTHATERCDHGFPGLPGCYVCGARNRRTPEPSSEHATAICLDHCPSAFTGRWRDWHRGSGCSLDDGGPRTEEGAAEIAALGVDHRRTPTERNDHG